ncbi:nuclear pore complex protein NUP107 [Selaginella moellendorffii]|uniref:nuclear pore complex protein NUP107 n=1 Tax=Selaginella moellendorffii TaxID=88036 RepID=UPI000D1CF2B4|nr:nuclear pore complex protein NUP107 [Selaginella moellendorffii]|eukprot:XP_024516066.1 nuclear pore complex protein NUP107 [Selaginella moellendorffii]
MDKNLGDTGHGIFQDSFERSASGVDTCLPGFASLPELLSEFEDICRDLAQAVRDEATTKHRAIEDRALLQSCALPFVWKRGYHGRESESNHAFIRTGATAQTCPRLVSRVWRPRNWI